MIEVKYAPAGRILFIFFHSLNYIFTAAGLPCPPGKKTDNRHGRCCVFPFVYGGKKYESCTKVAHDKLWCSLDKVYKGHWANCGKQ